MRPYHTPWPSQAQPADRLDPVNGLTARWLPLPGRVGGKKLLDASGNGFHFDLNAGTAAWSGDTYPGGFGSVTFNGSTDYQVTSVSPNTGLNPNGLFPTTGGNAGPFTAVLWAKATNFSNYYGFLSGRALNSGWTLGTEQTTGKMRGFGTGGVVSTNALTAGVWTHLAYTWTSAGAVAFYLNGVANGSGSAGAQPTSAVSLGCLNQGANFLVGSVGEVRVYNRILAAAEVAALYAAALGDGLRRVSPLWAVPSTANRRRRVICGGGN